ncbi:hypothetical protein FEM48_Zijuj12G0161200 [Ziziphus jujuba var. spinosa]|uniref:Uncharacterized protein n=1 Tax=Ziziphus jujuba var. spinosa TaxID=714518 RepID=A0A978UEB2_ZIZJJ|nr:hypothetical protein FEM48_Zijuj12G0161200 [Ziziphus jujuba var. spinosa]
MDLPQVGALTKMGDAVGFVSALALDTIQHNYSKAKDVAQVYDVKVKTIATKVIKTRCSEDAAMLKDFIEKDRIYNFLVGLNTEFNQKITAYLGTLLETPWQATKSRMGTKRRTMKAQGQANVAVQRNTVSL